jgi:hypothetical protein
MFLPVLSLCAAVCLCSEILSAQTLDIPPRPSGATGGDAVAASVSNLSRDQREEQLFQQVASGNVPAFLRQLVPVAMTAMIGGRLRTAHLYVAPEYIAVGSDSDYFLMPMTPLLAQRIADATGCTMPTRKMVDAIYAGSSVKVPPIPIPPSGAMITVPVFKQHNDTLRLQRAALLPAHPLGELVAGHKKDVVISNAITANLKPTVPKPVVIYGWHQLSGVPIQPLYNGHEQTYADYSHGIRLVQRAMMLDSTVTTVDEVLRDAALWPLLSDEGVVAKPRYGVTASGVPSEDAAPSMPDGFELRQNFPNPFNPTTTVRYTIGGVVAPSVSEGPAAAHVWLSVFDMLGREVAVLVDEQKEPGEYIVPFAGVGLSSGVYLCRLQAGTSVAVQKMILTK